MFPDPLLSLVVKVGIAVLFAAAAWHKASNLPQTGAVIAAYRIIPRGMSQLAAPALVAVELAVAAVSLFSSLGLHAAAIMLITYAVAISLNIVRKNDRIDCGCLGFGVVAPRLKWAMVARNFALGCLAEFFAVATTSGRDLVWIDFLSLAFAIAVLALLYAAHEAVIALPDRDALS